MFEYNTIQYDSSGDAKLSGDTETEYRSYGMHTSPPGQAKRSFFYYFSVEFIYTIFTIIFSFSVRVQKEDLHTGLKFCPLKMVIAPNTSELFDVITGI